MAENPALPVFRYHPNPVSTGNVKPSDVECICCGKSSGYIYTGSVYGGGDELQDRLCPWCIGSGKAAFKYGCCFVDGHPLEEAEIAQAIVIEVTTRTPGYSSWQQEVWQTCCDDACEFHGDASVSELTMLQGERLAQLQSDWPISPERWGKFLEDYVPGGGMAVYRFVCRHCGNVRYELDPA